MRILPGLLFPLAALLLASSAYGESATELLNTAQSAYLRGDIETAKRNFQLVNRIDPRNVTAIGYLRIIQAKEAQQAPDTKKEKALSAVILPKVEFRDATLGSALEYLKQQVEKATEGKMAVSFVVQLPDDAINRTTVTLSLTSIPFPQVLRYLGELAKVSFAYEQYAIVVRPLGANAGLKPAQ